MPTATPRPPVRPSSPGPAGGIPPPGEIRVTHYPRITPPLRAKSGTLPCRHVLRRGVGVSVGGVSTVGLPVCRGPVRGTPPPIAPITPTTTF
ncbi:hypothetical protein CXF36_07020 [Corynebacterium bovis]|nr:hypothetical protein CXF36_07020 [Corynebacterium bovis]